MLFFLSIILLGVVTSSLPIIVRHSARFFPAIRLYPANAGLPLLAGILMIISTQLPNINISSETSTFQQHFTGGGLYAACLYLYAKQLFSWRPHWLIDLLALFAWVSALGVANKLSEFALFKAGLAHIYTGDAYWDLLANTIGGFVGYFLLFKFAPLSNK